MLAFIDESGQPHPNDSNALSVLLALCVREVQDRVIARQLHTLKKTLRGTEDAYEIKADELMNERTLRRVPEKKELVEGAFEIIRNLDATIFAIIVPRPREIPDLPESHLPRQQLYLFQRINALAESMNENALLIYDGHGPNIQGRNLAECCSSYIFTVAEYHGILRRLVGTTLFVDSRVTPGIQLADLAASAVRQYHEYGVHAGVPVGNIYLAAINRYYAAAYAKTRNDLRNDYGHQLWGFYHLRQEQFSQRDEDTLKQEQTGEPESNEAK